VSVKGIAREPRPPYCHTEDVDGRITPASIFIWTSAAGRVSLLTCPIPRCLRRLAHGGGRSCYVRQP
jgi:hypothetical protein